MKVKDKTKHKIANSAIDLLKRKPLSKMTITDITSNCNMTRQIFYKYFIDKYDMIDWIYIQDWNIAILKVEKDFNFENFLLNILQILKEKSEFYSNALKTEDENSLEKLIFNRLIFVCSKLIAFKTGEIPTYKMEFLIKANCYSIVYSILDEIKSGMQKPSDQLKDWIIEAMPCEIKELLLNNSIPITMIKQWIKELENTDK